MPQMKAKKKIFRTRVDKNTQYFTLSISQILTVTELQQIQKNITGGAE